MPLFGELFVSEIIKRPVLDPKGIELGKVRDLIVVKGSPLPRVDALIVYRRKKTFRIEWKDINLFNKRIISSFLFTEKLSPYEIPEEDLLIARDILDKQIVDVNGAKVVRVNDVRLDGSGADALMVAVDVGMRGILRRLGFESAGEDALRIFRVSMPFNLISWDYIQPLNPKLSTIGLRIPRQMISDIHPADLAEIISQVTSEEGSAFMEHLEPEAAAEAFSELEPDDQEAIISGLTTDKASEIIEEMSADDAADVISSLSPEKAKEILENMDEESASDVQELLGHEEDTAGGLMTTEYIAYRCDMSVADAIERFKKDAPEIEAVYYIYVLDAEESLVGVLTLRDLILAPPDKKLSDVMEPRLVTMKPMDDEMVVAGLISKYNLVALPVVNPDDNTIMGIVTVDDVLDRVLPPKYRQKRRGI